MPAPGPPATAATTLSGHPLQPVYAMASTPAAPPPGEYPYTRGIYPEMYRKRLWTMRMFAGFGAPEDTNARFKSLLAHGQTGLSTAFDMPTLMGYDPDHTLSLGEVGREGVSVAHIDDMRRLFADIDLGTVSTSMTISGPAPVMLALFIAAAEEAGIPRSALRGTLQTDILKEFIAQKEWIVPERPGMRLVGDLIAFCTGEMPLWHPISVSGYHIREAGATAAQELAFTLADGLAYVDELVGRGLDPDTFLPRFSFFFNCHIDLFEEVAKIRAARRLWATLVRERYGVADPKSLQLRTHCQTSGASLTAQQPLVNIARTAIEALAGVLAEFPGEVAMVSSFGAEAAVFVSAVVFGLVHALGDPSVGTMIALPAIILLGVVSGYQAATTGNLSRSILLHVGFNALSVVFLFTS